MGNGDDDISISHESKRHNKDDEGWQSPGDRLLQIVTMREMQRECAWVQKCNVEINVPFYSRIHCINPQLIPIW